MDISNTIKLAWFVHTGANNIVTMPVTYTDVNTYTFSRQWHGSSGGGYVSALQIAAYRYSSSQVFKNYYDGGFTDMFIAIGY